MTWTVDIDGTDITSLCQSITWRPKLSRPASLVVRVPGHLVNASVGTSEMHLYNGGLLFSGPVWFLSDDGDPDATYTQITAYDHLIYLNKRLCHTPADWDDPVVNDHEHPGPCNLADPTQVLVVYSTATEIMAAFLQAANDCTHAAGPSPWPIVVGSVQLGGSDMTGAPAEWPMNVQDMADLLMQSGQLYMMVHPGIGSSTVDLRWQIPVNDLSGSVSLDYATGNFNSQTATKTLDMADVTNALWYLLGPRRHFYAGDISHWAGSITPSFKNSGYDGNKPNGEPGEPWPPDLTALWSTSRGLYGYMQEIQIYDERDDEQTTVRPMFENIYEKESRLRALPRTISAVKPERESGGGIAFAPGDLISMSAGIHLGGGFSGTTIVYEYEINVDADGVAEFTDLITSPDGN